MKSPGNERSRPPVFKGFVGVVAAASPDLLEQWNSFKAAHGKTYTSHHEPSRFAAFKDNVKFIEEHNEKFARGEVTYELGLNAHSDLTPDEFKKAHFGLVFDEDNYASLSMDKHVKVRNVRFIDWKKRGKVSKVKNQNPCGSCYAFATTGLAESHLKIHNMYKGDLSEQDIIDCSYKKSRDGQMNDGCDGGDILFTLEDTLKRGLANESMYPYTSNITKRPGRCKSNGEVHRKRLPFFNLVYVEANENDYANALQRGPLAVFFNGENADFYKYKSGIYDNPKCSQVANHATLLVGYERDNNTNQEYWIIKNSWGPTWGEQGYMKLIKGVNRCGFGKYGALYLR